MKVSRLSVAKSRSIEDPRRCRNRDDLTTSGDAKPLWHDVLKMLCVFAPLRLCVKFRSFSRRLVLSFSSLY